MFQATDRRLMVWDPVSFIQEMMSFNLRLNKIFRRCENFTSGQNVMNIQ